MKYKWAHQVRATALLCNILRCSNTNRFSLWMFSRKPSEPFFVWWLLSRSLLTILLALCESIFRIVVSVISSIHYINYIKETKCILMLSATYVKVRFNGLAVSEGGWVGIFKSFERIPVDFSCLWIGLKICLRAFLVNL